VLLIAGAAYLLPRLFEQPPQQVQVPNLIGLSEKQARSAIGDANLAVGQIDFKADQDVAKDKVISQDPNRDQYVDPGSRVDFVISTGKPLATVPSVVGQDKDAAKAALRQAHFKVILKQTNSDEPAGQVISTDPGGGESVPQGSTVTVSWSDGPEQVPDVVGMKQADAEKAIRAAGFQPDVVESSSTTEPKGTVIQQSPKPGQTAAQGSTVTILVSSFEPPSQSPSPTDTTSPSPTPPLPSGSPTLPPSARLNPGPSGGGPSR